MFNYHAKQQTIHIESVRYSRHDLINWYEEKKEEKKEKSAKI